MFTNLKILIFKNISIEEVRYNIQNSGRLRFSITTTFTFTFSSPQSYVVKKNKNVLPLIKAIKKFHGLYKY